MPCGDGPVQLLISPENCRQIFHSCTCKYSSLPFFKKGFFFFSLMLCLKKILYLALTQASRFPQLRASPKDRGRHLNTLGGLCSYLIALFTPWERAFSTVFSSGQEKVKRCARSDCSVSACSWALEVLYLVIPKPAGFCIIKDVHKLSLQWLCYTLGKEQISSSNKHTPVMICEEDGHKNHSQSDQNREIRASTGLSAEYQLGI